MCGLAGVFSPSRLSAEHANQLQRMHEALQARGPDGEGKWCDDKGFVTFAHRRLAVVDLSEAGAQPMHSLDKRFTIVFNGEIYNHVDLREMLQRDGVTFRGNSDTEVLLNLYARHGAGMCALLRGMFALVIWDCHERSLFMARDVFGIKPLYVHELNGTVRFASQVRALLASGAVAPKTNPAAEAGYRLWGHVPEPASWIQGINMLPPGTWCRWSCTGDLQRGVFADLATLLSGDISPRKNHDSLRAALQDTVEAHLQADIPVGVFLSGGIDSATLASMVKSSGATLRTLTVGFEPYRGTSADETPLAEALAKQLGARHHTVWIGLQEFRDALPKFLSDMDQPSLDGLNTWLVSRAAASVGLKVVLSGLGGDEFFGGYPSFHQLPRIRQLMRPFARLPWLGQAMREWLAPLLRRFTSEKYAGLAEFGSSWSGAYLLRRGVLMPWQLPWRGQQIPGLPDQLPSLDDFGMVSWFESHLYMRNQLLRDADWASMAHGVELRVPFVDMELVSFLAQSRRAGKTLRKQDLAACPLPPLPEAIRHRPKTGFTVPIREFMSDTRDQGPESRGLQAWQAKVWDAQSRALEQLP